jgi:hemin uptake protein HemP
LKNSKLESATGDESPAGPVRAIPVNAHRMESRDIFVGTREVTIAHAGETYRLRLTAQHKLILTK